MGPSADVCQQALRGRRTQVLDHVDHLMSVARQLERQATDIR
jgi:hypothetical protein